MPVQGETRKIERDRAKRAVVMRRKFAGRGPVCAGEDAPPSIRRAVDPGNRLLVQPTLSAASDQKASRLSKGMISTSRKALGIGASANSTHSINPVRPRPPIVARNRSVLGGRTRRDAAAVAPQQS